MLATKEIRRGKGRFASIIAALSLIVFLVLTLGALADGLFYGATGALRSSTADGYAFSDEGEGSLIRSSLTQEQVAAVAAAPGVAAASGIGVLLTSGSVAGELTDLAVFGVDPAGVGLPAEVSQGRLPAPGETGVAAVDERLAQDFDLGVGDEVAVGPVALQVVGIVPDVSYQGQPTVWTSVPDWREMRAAVRPEFTGVDNDVSAVAVQFGAGATAATAAEVAAALPGIAVLTTDETGLAIPGVAQQKSTLNAIIYTALAVAAIVVALFFALLVLEKRELFAALKALGTPNRKLGSGVIVQALLASAVGIVVGAIAARGLGMVLPEGVPALFRPETLLTTALFTLGAGVLGAVFSLRRIARIDPATAIGGAL
jgi:putative ABC transport system permease protein